MSLRIAKSRGDSGAVEKLNRLLHPEMDLHFANGFDHPEQVIYTSDAPREPQLMSWGLIPAWVKDSGQADEIRNRTLIARGESMLEKPSFRISAESKRCLVFVEGFYEHHHFGKRTYPYFIHLKDRPHFALAGLWDEWKDKNSGNVRRTFSIVTCEPNDLMRRIHNNPKVDGARMPVILTEAEEEHWLAPVNSRTDMDALMRLVRPYPTDAMTAYPVAPLLGKSGSGNTPKASDPYEYPELLLADPLW
ncbi:MAG: SOS response-associated peptidase [Flavobacteriales bacterium]|nr:SOS response-associated peptidase [Flavobacteriales bacterium]